MSSILDSNRVITINVKSFLMFICLRVQVSGIPWYKTGATTYHAHFELPDKSRAIKELLAMSILSL